LKKLIIEGKRELTGEIKISGAKNSIVALIPATILTKGKCVIHNVPDISDVRILIEIMESLGSIVHFENEVLTIDNKNVENKPIGEKYASKLRASYYFMGSLLGQFQQVDIANPGGCVIGSRPFDFHIDAFKRMGIHVEEKMDSYHMCTDELKATDIFFDFPSVGATINVLLASVLAKGTTRIINAAREPEIENLADFLNSMGARIVGAGSGTIEIKGVESLNDGEISVIPDRIEAGTYLIIGALLGHHLKITDIVEKHLYSLLYKLKDAGVHLEVNGNDIIINKSEHLKAVNIKTTVYPGFPTDIGQPMSVLLTQCNGKSSLKETIWENRMGHIPSLNKMGAKINVENNVVSINGPTKLHGSEVIATDLRGGASLVIAGLIADGTTIINDVEHILRGYENIVLKLTEVGAKIELKEI